MDAKMLRPQGKPQKQAEIILSLVMDDPVPGSDSDAASGSDALERDRLGVGPVILARFLDKINKNGPIPRHCPALGPCWLWTANTVKGYGQFVLPRDADGKQPHVYAHRFAYELVHGPFESADVKACHRCDFTLCCRPSHVFKGSQADNLSDARRKGRLIDGAHLIKLSDADLAYIRANYRPRKNGKQLAAHFGIHLVTLLRVVAGTERAHQRRAKQRSALVGGVKVAASLRGEKV
jgi:hypothetical protein